ncbi:MAG: hypothetical protein L0Y71_19195 [Gemmataceae bacterium]|nr:hypothetical protein [Gemmataceae bacterium]
MKPDSNANGSIVLETKPPGWIIQAAQTEDGLLLHWPLDASLLIRVRVAWERFLLPIWLGGWLGGGMFVVSRVLAGDVSKGVFVGLVFWLLGATLMTLLLIAAYRPAQPESVLLDDDWFSYDPGVCYPVTYRPRNAILKLCWHVFHTPSRTVIPREHLAKFELVGAGHGQRLRFQRDLDSIEIGNCLTESEREWLFGVLEHWRSGMDLDDLARTRNDETLAAGPDSTAIRADSTDIRR